MNHELRCYLRLRINIPNEILLLIEKYLWQLKLAPTNLKMFLMYERMPRPYQPGLYYLHKTLFKAIAIHSYGPNCQYNQSLGHVHRGPLKSPSLLHIHHGRLYYRSYK